MTFWENLKWQDRTFYSANKIVKSPTGQQVSELLNIDVNKGEVLIDTNDISDLSERNVEVNYERVNPTRYIVHIKNESPFILVFSELFNDVWQASNHEIVYKHFRANFYANGWLIDKTGEFDIVVEYLPQNLLEIGEKISVISYIIIALAFIHLVSRKKIKK